MDQEEVLSFGTKKSRKSERFHSQIPIPQSEEQQEEQYSPKKAVENAPNIRIKQIITEGFDSNNSPKSKSERKITMPHDNFSKAQRQFQVPPIAIPQKEQEQVQEDKDKHNFKKEGSPKMSALPNSNSNPHINTKGELNKAMEIGKSPVSTLQTKAQKIEAMKLKMGISRQLTVQSQKKEKKEGIVKVLLTKFSSWTRRIWRNCFRKKSKQNQLPMNKSSLSAKRRVGVAADAAEKNSSGGEDNNSSTYYTKRDSARNSILSRNTPSTISMMQVDQEKIDKEIKQLKDAVKIMTKDRMFQKAYRHLIDGLLYRSVRHDLDGEDSLKRKFILFIWRIQNSSLWNDFLLFLGWVYIFMSFFEPANRFDSSLDQNTFLFMMILEIFILSLQTLDLMMEIIQRSSQEHTSIWASLITRKKNFFRLLFFLLNTSDLINYVSQYPTNTFRFARVFRPLQIIIFSKSLRRNFQGIINSAKNLLMILFFDIIITSFWAYVGINMIGDLYNDPTVDTKIIDFRDFFKTANSLYIFSSLDIFPDLLFPAVSNSFYYLFYFLPFIVMFLLLFVPIPVAVVYEGFRKHRLNLLISDRIKRRKALWACYQCIVQDAKKSSITKAEFVSFFNFVYQKVELDEHAEIIADVLYNELDSNDNKKVSIEEFFTVLDFTEQRSEFRLQRMKPFRWWITFRDFLQNKFDINGGLESKKWEAVSFLFTIGSCILTILFIVSDSTSSTFVANFFDKMFFTFFVLEIVLKILAVGINQFFDNSWNVFDLTLVLFQAFFDYIFVTFMSTSNVKSVSASRVLKIAKLQRIFRMFRAFRTVKVLNYILSGLDIIKKVYEMLYKIVICIPIVMKLSVICVIVLYIYSAIGVEIFTTQFRQMYESEYGRQECDQTAPDQTDFNSCQYVNFDKFGGAVILLLQVCIGNGWGNILFDYGKKFDDLLTSAIFFNSFHFLAVFVLSLIGGLVWEVFDVVERIMRDQQALDQQLELQRQWEEQQQQIEASFQSTDQFRKNATTAQQSQFSIKRGSVRQSLRVYNSLAKGPMKYSIKLPSNQDEFEDDEIMEQYEQNTAQVTDQPEDKSILKNQQQDQSLASQLSDDDIGTSQESDDDSSSEDSLEEEEENDQEEQEKNQNEENNNENDEEGGGEDNKNDGENQNIVIEKNGKDIKSKRKSKKDLVEINFDSENNIDKNIPNNLSFENNQDNFSQRWKNNNDQTDKFFQHRFLSDEFTPGDITDNTKNKGGIQSIKSDLNSLCQSEQGSVNYEQKSLQKQEQQQPKSTKLLFGKQSSLQGNSGSTYKKQLLLKQQLSEDQGFSSKVSRQKNIHKEKKKKKKMSSQMAELYRQSCFSDNQIMTCRDKSELILYQDIFRLSTMDQFFKNGIKTMNILQFEPGTPQNNNSTLQLDSLSLQPPLLQSTSSSGINANNQISNNASTSNVVSSNTIGLVKKLSKFHTIREEDEEYIENVSQQFTNLQKQKIFKFNSVEQDKEIEEQEENEKTNSQNQNPFYITIPNAPEGTLETGDEGDKIFSNSDKNSTPKTKKLFSQSSKKSSSRVEQNLAIQEEVESVEENAEEGSRPQVSNRDNYQSSQGNISERVEDVREMRIESEDWKCKQLQKTPVKNPNVIKQLPNPQTKHYSLEKKKDLQDNHNDEGSIESFKTLPAFKFIIQKEPTSFHMRSESIYKSFQQEQEQSFQSQQERRASLQNQQENNFSFQSVDNYYSFQNQNQEYQPSDFNPNKQHPKPSNQNKTSSTKQITSFGNVQNSNKQLEQNISPCPDLSSSSSHHSQISNSSSISSTPTIKKYIEKQTSHGHAKRQRTNSPNKSSKNLDMIESIESPHIRQFPQKQYHPSRSTKEAEALHLKEDNYSEETKLRSSINQNLNEKGIHSQNDLQFSQIDDAFPLQNQFSSFQSPSSVSQPKLELEKNVKSSNQFASSIQSKNTLTLVTDDETSVVKRKTNSINNKFSNFNIDHDLNSSPYHQDNNDEQELMQGKIKTTENETLFNTRSSRQQIEGLESALISNNYDEPHNVLLSQPPMLNMQKIKSKDLNYNIFKKDIENQHLHQDSFNQENDSNQIEINNKVEDIEMSFIEEMQNMQDRAFNEPNEQNFTGKHLEKKLNKLKRQQRRLQLLEKCREELFLYFKSNLADINSQPDQHQYQYMNFNISGIQSGQSGKPKQQNVEKGAQRDLIQDRPKNALMKNHLLNINHDLRNEQQVQMKIDLNNKNFIINKAILKSVDLNKIQKIELRHFRQLYGKEFEDMLDKEFFPLWHLQSKILFHFDNILKYDFIPVEQFIQIYSSLEMQISSLLMNKFSSFKIIYQDMDNKWFTINFVQEAYFLQEVDRQGPWKYFDTLFENNMGKQKIFKHRNVFSYADKSEYIKKNLKKFYQISQDISNNYYFRRLQMNQKRSDVIYIPFVNDDTEGVSKSLLETLCKTPTLPEYIKKDDMNLEMIPRIKRGLAIAYLFDNPNVKQRKRQYVSDNINIEEAIVEEDILQKAQLNNTLNYSYSIELIKDMQKHINMNKDMLFKKISQFYFYRQCFEKNFCSIMEIPFEQ